MAQPNYNNMSVVKPLVSEDNLNGYDKLARCSYVYIKQKVNAATYCGVGMENAYYVFKSNEAGQKKGEKIFKCVEKSSFCARCCMK